MSSFMKICSFGTVLFNADARTDEQIDITKLIVAFHNYANAWIIWYVLGVTASVTFNMMNKSELFVFFFFVHSSWETIGHSLGQEIPFVYLTQRFTTVFRRSRNLTITWVRYIQFPSLRYILILASSLCLSSLFCSDFRTKILSAFFSSPMRRTCLTYFMLLNLITITSHSVISVKSPSSCYFLSSFFSFSLHPNILFL